MQIASVVVTGGRRFTDYNRVEDDLRRLLPHGLSRVAEGQSPGGGADDLAYDAWHLLVNRSTERYPPDPNLDGRDVSRFPRRNIRMLETERPDLVLAYPDPNSRGTWHCVKQAIHRGSPAACWVGPEYDYGDSGMYRHHKDKPNELVMSFGAADVVDFNCILGESARVIVVPSKGRGVDAALALGRFIRDVLAT